MIFPKPQCEKYAEGKYTLTSDIPNSGLMELYAACKNGIDGVSFSYDVSLGEDAYEMVISADGVKISCGTESGRFRAVATLFQLLNSHGADLTYAEIKDAPHYARRGYMLDVSRCRITKLDSLKKTVDYLAELKYNEFQLYMENFCFKFPGFPNLTKDFECLTPEDIMELDAYCAERFIDLVPNQNCFGHMATWLAEKEFAHLGVGDGSRAPDTLNILLPETKEFVEKLFDSVLPYFRSEYVNVGLDEAFGLGKYQLAEICREKGKAAVFMDWLAQVSDLIKTKYGKTVMFWSDMVYEAKEHFHLIPKGAVALNWGYDLIETALADRRCAYLEEKGIPFYVCPGTSLWRSFTGRFDLMTFNMRTMAEFGYKHGARGYLLTDWGNGFHVNYPVFSLVPIALGAQYSWNSGAVQDGSNMKHGLLTSAQRFVDARIFGGKRVSHLHYKLGQAYLLEPKRFHCLTMSSHALRISINETNVFRLFDLKDEDPFYFENVVQYLEKTLGLVMECDFDATYKRQTILNTKMYILAAELCIIRINKCAEKEKLTALIALIDEIVKEHRELWLMECYEKGIEKFEAVVAARRSELCKMLDKS